MKNPLYPCLWFNGNARKAADFYCAVFPNSRLIADTGIVVICELNGRKFMLLNGGGQFQFTEAVSFVIECSDQNEIDSYWEVLTREGKESNCGWLKDKFGLSWQVIPHHMGELMMHPEKGERAMQALLKMKKIIISELENA